MANGRTNIPENQIIDENNEIFNFGDSTIDETIDETKKKTSGINLIISDNKLDKVLYLPNIDEYKTLLLNNTGNEICNLFGECEEIGELFYHFFVTFKKLISNNQKINGNNCFDLIPEIDTILFLFKNSNIVKENKLIKKIQKFLDISKLTKYKVPNNEIEKYYGPGEDFIGNCDDHESFGIGTILNYKKCNNYDEILSLFNKILKSFKFHFNRIERDEKRNELLYKNMTYRNNIETILNKMNPHHKIKKEQ